MSPSLVKVRRTCISLEVIKIRLQIVKDMVQIILINTQIIGVCRKIVFLRPMQENSLNLVSTYSGEVPRTN